MNKGALLGGNRVNFSPIFEEHPESTYWNDSKVRLADENI